MGLHRDLWGSMGLGVGRNGALWVSLCPTDTATCEGRSLLRAFVTAAVKRAEPVDVVLLEVTREQFGVGLSPDVKKQLRFHDDGADPRGWLGGDGGRAAPWGCNGAGPNSMVVLDSLSAALLRERPHVAGRKLRAAMGAGRVVALLHRDLHPPPLLQALGGALSPTRLILGEPRPPNIRHVVLIPRGGRPKAELFRLLPDLSVLPVGTPPQVGAAGGGGDEAHPPSPPHFRQLPPPPYLLSAARRAELLRGDPIPAPPEDPEDPDDDLDV